MATLAGSTIASTYPLLLKIDTNGLDGTLRAVQDGDATDSVLSLATDSALISGNGTKLYFYDADGGEHISADNAGNLTIGAGADINLTATTDINIPADVGLTFGHASNQKIEGDGTDLAVSATGNINITSTVNEAASIYLRENAGTSGTIKIHADQGTADTSIDILSDAGGISITSGNDKDVFIKGSDGGSGITAATFDMSDAGTLSLNGDLKVPAEKKIYLDGGGNTYIVESSSDVFKLVRGGDDKLVANALGLGIGKTPSYALALSGMSGGDLDIKDVGTTSATEAGWIQVAIGTASDSYIRTYSSK
jgi:hypothetical protein